MKRRTGQMINRIAAAASLALCSAFAGANEGDTATRTYLRVGKVLTMDAKDTVVNNAVVVISGSKIESVSKASDVEIPADAHVIEMTDAWLVPGLVECHNHTAGAMGDLHDYVYLTNPGLRTLDTIEITSDNFELAQAGGVTSALLIPGSGTNMSGFGTVVKFGGETIDEAVLKFPGSVKVAQSGNPERYWWGVGRMFMNFNTRLTLVKAREYHRQREAMEAVGVEAVPDPTWEEFRDLFRRNYIASVHTQAHQVVMTTLDMLADRLKIRTVLDHSTFDGWKTAPLVVALGDVVTINGPRQFQFDRSQRKIHGNAARWWQGGVRKLGLNTDSPVIPQEELSYQGAMACWYGWTPYEALKGLTAICAEALMVDDRVGSIEAGKDADLAIWSGDPLDPRSTCWITIVSGEIVRDARESDRPRRF